MGLVSRRFPTPLPPGNEVGNFVDFSLYPAEAELFVAILARWDEVGIWWDENVDFSVDVAGAA
jgi:hypothetical protein